MRDDWLMGSTAAQDAYTPVDDPWTRMDASQAYRGMPRLDPGLRRAPGDTAMLPAAETFADLSTRIPRGIAHSLYDFATLPRDVDQGTFKYTPPGGGPLRTEEDYFQQSLLDKERSDRAAGAALTLAMPWRVRTAPGEVAFGAGGGARNIRRSRPAPEPVEPNPRAVMGGNQPPPDMVIEPTPPPSPRGRARAASPPETMGAVVDPASEAITQSTKLPNLRDLPVEQATAIAAREPHLIPSRGAEDGGGAYVGGPRNIKSYDDLLAMRANYDAYAGADPRGWDWYDRYRDYQRLVHGNDPTRLRWSSPMHGQWSAGVSPETEQAFVLKEQNAALAGMPTRAYRGREHDALLEAIRTRSTKPFILGEKTGKYADVIMPRASNEPRATSVNDFRHATNLGYTEVSGETQKQGLKGPQHRFADYETALAVKRANETKLGGRDDWTGEQLQAAPWVRQKAFDLMEQRPGLTYEEAFQLANRTAGDFVGKHTAFATYEAQPGIIAEHMDRSQHATQAEREAYARDPLSRWDNAKYRRDAIYSGLRVPGTGIGMDVMPTTPMQGMFMGPRGLETNPGYTARPQIGFERDMSQGGRKNVTDADRALLNAGEAVRSYIDAQIGGAWHKTWAGGRAGDSNSLYFPRDRKSTVNQLLAVQQATGKHGIGDIADTGTGITATIFGDTPAVDIGKPLRKGDFDDVVKGSAPYRVRVEGNYLPHDWSSFGSGNATRGMLEYVNKTPEIRAAFNNNGDIARNAMNRLLRDEKWAAKWGAPREDIQNARRIIGDGSKGWIDRLEAALKAGAVLPVTAAAIYAGAAASVPQPGDEGQL